LEIARLIFDLEDGDDTFLRNVGSHTEYTALYPRRWQHFINAAKRTSNFSNLFLNRTAIKELLLEDVIR
jgi:hypothetical protein